MNIRKNKKGFTLMELVVTTAIMGTLATVAVPSYLEIQAKTKATKTMANISEMGSEVGRKFNALSSTYGRVQLGSGSVQTGIVVINNTNILTAGSGGTVKETYYWGPDSLGTAYTSNVALFPGGVYKSPFDNKPYVMDIVQPGFVEYSVDESGNVTVIVTKAELVIADPEDLSNLVLTFSY